MSALLARLIRRSARMWLCVDQDSRGPEPADLGRPYRRIAIAYAAAAGCSLRGIKPG
jgi:hypothetical protein